MPPETLSDAALGRELEALLAPGRVLARPIDRIAFASDASFYRLLPRAVVQPVSVEEVAALFSWSRRRRMPLTFRAAGTSLSGQAVSDGVLVELSRHWGNLAVEDGGRLVRVQPGVIGGHVNLVLRDHHRRIGPDPASIDTCMMGGILANNASGMCCGVAENAYHTLHSLTCVLPGSAVVDTGAAGAARRLAETSPDLAEGLLELRRRLLANSTLAQRVGAKYRTKNTTGYSLNALLDHAEPHQILAHLLIGSEGTLAFIAEAVLRTLPAYPLRHTGLLHFPDVHSAASAIAALRDSGARAVEIMDRAALRSVQDQPGAPEELPGLPPRAAALLVEYQCEGGEELAAARRAAAQATAGLPLLHPPAFTDEEGEQAALWRIRKGLYPSIGAARPQGTAVIIEDVAFPLTRLADAVLDLQRMFAAHGYADAIIFGHAKDGNLHFVLSQSFNEEAEVERYRRFMDDLAALVVDRYDGALKAEHGTGRNVAPFVEREWGTEALALMRGIKALFDPEGLLNPGVIVNGDPLAHVRHLKDLPVVEPEVDRCIECGFCEPHCPSRRLTTTPRQRIVVRREVARLRASGRDPGLLASLVADYAYAALDTCATDGMCATACPVAIDTGQLVKRLRGEALSAPQRRRAFWLAWRFAAAEGLARLALRAGHFAVGAVGAGRVAGGTRRAGKLLHRRLPVWNRGMPHVANRRPPRLPRESAEVVYFPSCLSRVMGVPAGEPRVPPLAETLTTLAARAGVALWVPPDARGHCCGMPFGSKGYADAHHECALRLAEKLWEWSQEGRLPVVVDASSCAYTLRGDGDLLAPPWRGRWRRLTLLDAVELVHDTLLPRLSPRRLPLSVLVHPNCAARKLHLDEKLAAVVRACAREAHVPLHLECCAAAGDRVLLVPELAASAVAPEAAEIESGAFDRFVASNLTCEMGLTATTGFPFRSFLYLVEEATRRET